MYFSQGKVDVVGRQFSPDFSVFLHGSGILSKGDAWPTCFRSWRRSVSLTARKPEIFKLVMFLSALPETLF